MTRIKTWGLVAGILVAALCLLLPLEGLGDKGQVGLALSLMTVTFWAFQIAQTGYTSGLYLVLLVILKVAEPKTVFSTWLNSSIYLIIGAYLIAGAVKSSGLGERIAYLFMLRFVTSFKSLIVSIFILTFGLSLIIPHAWPRAFLIMSVMLVLIETAKVPRVDAVKIGFTVFAASVPVSMIFLTGASVTNPLAIEYAGVELGWMGWLRVMGLPAAFASVMTCLLILLLFKPSKPLVVDKAAIGRKLQELGKLGRKEKRIIVWLSIAIALWTTDSIHKIDIGWVTFLLAMLMSLPVIGGVVDGKSWKDVPIHVLLFITAAVAIGKVGAETGMNAWIAQAVLPSYVPTNIFVLAALVTSFTILVHMLLGSVLAVMGVAIPALLVFTEPLGISPLVTSLWAYSVIGTHYILPFHHMNTLVGQGEGNGLYSQKETIRLGIPLTAVVYLMTTFVEVGWWKAIGLL